MKFKLRKQYSPEGMFDASGLTLDRDGLTDVNKILFEKKMISAPFTDIITIDEGIKHDQQIIISEEFNELSGSGRENCDTTPNPYKIKASDMTYSPKKIGDRIEDCYDNIAVDTFWKRFLKPGNKKPDLTSTEYEAYVLKRMSLFMADPLFYRLFFLSNTAITAGTSNILSSGQLKYFNRFNGFFSQLETIGAAVPARKITIDENNGADYAAQAYATATESVQPVTEYLMQVYYGAPVELQADLGAYFLVDQATANQYKQERLKAAKIEMAYTRLEKGMAKLEFMGLPVIPLPTIDALQNKWFNNGTRVEDPHFIIMATKDNLRAGTESSGAFAEISSEYSSYHKKWFGDYEFTLDPKIPMTKFIQFAR